MIIALTIACVILAAMAVVLLGAQVELYEQVKQIRRFLDLTDTVTDLEVKELGARPSSVGLPAELDNEQFAQVLFLSDKCATCQTLAATLRGGSLSRNMWLVVVPVGGKGDAFINAYELVGERIVTDEREEISQRLDLTVTPAALEVVNGRITGARTVPSVRHLREMSNRKAKATN